MVSIASRYIEARRDPVSLTPHTEESIKTDANTEEPHRNIVLQGRDTGSRETTVDFSSNEETPIL